MVGAAVAAARYAPADPTLPPPWRALVDGNKGYIYYWNPDTNITQYDKPLPLGRHEGEPEQVAQDGGEAGGSAGRDDSGSEAVVPDDELRLEKEPPTKAGATKAVLMGALAHGLNMPVPVYGGASSVAAVNGDHQWFSMSAAIFKWVG